MLAAAAAVTMPALRAHAQVERGVVVCPPDSACPCDWNGDGVVNGVDQAIFNDLFANNQADANCDGVVDGDDFFSFMSCFAAPPPECARVGVDDCAIGPPSIGEGDFPFSTLDASTDGPPEPLCGAPPSDQIHNDIWVCYTPSCNGLAAISTCSSDFDTMIAVYDGCGCPAGPGAAIACNDDSCGLQSEVVVPVIAGNSYLIRVGGFGGAVGTGLLVIECGQPPAPPCPADEATQCQPRTNANARPSTFDRFAAAENFTPRDTALVDSVCWWGGYFPPDMAPLPDQFLINFYEDDGTGLPGALIASYVQGVTPGFQVIGPVPTGDVIAGETPEFAYTAVLPEPIEFEEGVCYWCEIINQVPPPALWAWSVSDDPFTGDGRSLQSGNGSPGSAPPGIYAPTDVVPMDMSLCLSGPDRVAFGFGASTCPGSPPDVQRPEDAVDEAETCNSGGGGGGANDNGGCDSSAQNPPLEDVTAGTPVFGTIWAEGGQRDTDWYRLTLPAESDITIQVIAEFDGFVEVRRDICPGTVHGTGGFVPGAGIQLTGPGQPPGELIIIVGPNSFEGIPCTRGVTANEYLLEVQVTATATGACIVPVRGCCPDACTQATANACSASGGVYMGDGAPCPIIENPYTPCDWNNDTSVDTADFFEFFDAFFAAGTADYDCSGTQDTADFFGFFGCFFSGLDPHDPAGWFCP